MKLRFTDDDEEEGGRERERGRGGTGDDGSKLAPLERPLFQLKLFPGVLGYEGVKGSKRSLKEGLLATNSERH